MNVKLLLREICQFIGERNSGENCCDIDLVERLGNRFLLYLIIYESQDGNSIFESSTIIVISHRHALRQSADENDTGFSEQNTVRSKLEFLRRGLQPDIGQASGIIQQWGRESGLQRHRADAVYQCGCPQINQAFER